MVIMCPLAHAVSNVGTMVTTRSKGIRLLFVFILFLAVLFRPVYRMATAE